MEKSVSEIALPQLAGRDSLRNHSEVRPIPRVFDLVNHFDTAGENAIPANARGSRKTAGTASSL